VPYIDVAAIEDGLDDVRASPRDDGRLEMIVRRPAVDEREVVAEAELDTELGLVGDSWSTRASTAMGDGRPDPAGQLTLMNARFARLVAGEPARVPLAGDQLFVDLDLSVGNLPVGTRLRVGGTVLEISAKPHNGCDKFKARFGVDALRVTRKIAGQELRLRGVYAVVLQGGPVRVDDVIAVERQV
jgi:hypothetical protein